MNAIDRRAELACRLADLRRLAERPKRLVQSSIEDIAYARRIGRLRGFYVDLAPELEPYLANHNRPDVA